MLILKRLLTTSCTLLDTSPKNYYKIIAPSTFETKKCESYNEKHSSTTTEITATSTATVADTVEDELTITHKTKRKFISTYKRSTHPTSVPLSKIFSNNFPLSINESFEDYKYRNNPLKFQHDLLSILPFYPTPDPQVKTKEGRSSEVLKVEIDDKGNYINEFVIYPENYNPQVMPDDEYHHLIMVHGYGAGLGFFLKNFDEISNFQPNNTQNNKYIVHAIDLLGYGCSSRPNFYPQNLDQVENWFHDSFITWLQKRNIPSDKTIVMAHSMGAYLMATLAINRNLKFCSKLLMVSPGAIIKHQTPVQVPRYFVKLWERNISPFTIVRKLGPLGSKIVSGWSSRRFDKLTRQEKKLLHKYSYGIFQSKGSGEYMLNYLLAPGADARHPLVDRGIDRITCDVSWWYGKEDWMDKKGGQICSAIINNKGEFKSDVKIIEDSGHHIYLDNIKKFNSMVLEEMNQLINK
ncbi:cardiolipin-specific phospholipase [Candida albicans L26]|uniref:Carboxylic ester hydrolase n=2 Tax=Candida albicans TaxID=5476 RepID=A0A1D8PPD3_CANAL|nr:carboxylic ester hydrolase [Candida albicans SC5314]KAF6071053.1 Alpha/beta hydrolase family protein [Candida albicans]KGQ85931.1 cardiolipin-specific phospholipase [Candida albicans P37005]KGQ89739.1 cardiolipin-specific phospholipase [Candida albicans GC75]KGT65924.1 cardiolipin-specific phospholipase [Candida albicans 12C]KGU04647.1 cardiolipin-specific phospholipase [Candida albicans P87]KGU05347.1 cardiolipin-specific phospholipase [Candida albicans 19F]KGU05821.1 cardiolipin-specifi|eukprot:XP_711262.2 carboxylic ester hydrolase [Candida albicans SC5314]